LTTRFANSHRVKTKLWTISINQDLIEKVKDHAEQNNMKQNQIVTLALKQYFAATSTEKVVRVDITDKLFLAIAKKCPDQIKQIL